MTGLPRLLGSVAGVAVVTGTLWLGASVLVGFVVGAEESALPLSEVDSVTCRNTNAPAAAMSRHKKITGAFEEDCFFFLRFLARDREFATPLLWQISEFTE